MPKTVLVTDDDDNARDALCRLIERSGIDCVQAENGLEALNVLRTREVHVIIADHDMPGMDGVELLKLVSTRYPQVTRILLTARHDAETAVRAINLSQAYRFLSKPCRSVDLLTTLYFALERADAEIESRKLSAQLRLKTSIIEQLRRRYPGEVEALENQKPPATA